MLEQVIHVARRCTVVLLGNHEEMLLAALEGLSELRYRLKFGGTEALASCGYQGGPELRPADLPALIPSSIFSSSRAAGTLSRRCGTSSSTPATNPTDRSTSNSGAD